MNRLLARTIGFLNALLAIAFIVIGAVVGAASMGHVGGLVIGAIVGFIIALIACGLVAIVIEIHAELTRIRIALEQRPSAAGTA